jgi:tetrapyrrole methylase family protein/MazG family protein
VGSERRGGFPGEPASVCRRPDHHDRGAHWRRRHPLSGRITVVGLGPAGPELLTAATLAAIDEHPVRFLRTARHPAAVSVPGAVSFDGHYEGADRIEDVYRAIVADLVAAASDHGRVLYAVPGSPAVAEHTVELLRASEEVELTVLAALSCLDLVWARLGVDPLRDGVRVVDGQRFGTEAAGERGPLLILQCDRPSVLADIKLAVDDPGDASVVVLHHLGLPDERIDTVAWNDLDRVTPDHLTSLWVPSLASPVGRELLELADLVRHLRDACPWDRVQTHETLRPYVIEEAYEVVDAIDRGDPAELEEELGDLLFQVYFHATLAAESGDFDLAAVARSIHDKLVRRHPHVFDPDNSHPDWDGLKALEKGPRGTLDGVPHTFPALAYAQKIQRRAAKVGFDWADVEGAWPKVDEEIRELRAAGPGQVEEELGDLLFACVNVARHLGVDAEVALRGATAKFVSRFTRVEEVASARGIEMSTAGLAVLDAIWDEVKGLAGPDPAGPDPAGPAGA